MDQPPLLRLPNELLELLSWFVRVEDVPRYVRACKRLLYNSQRRIEQHQCYLSKYHRVKLDSSVEQYAEASASGDRLVGPGNKLVSDAHNAVRDLVKARYIRHLTVVCYRARDERAMEGIFYNISSEKLQREPMIHPSQTYSLASAIHGLPPTTIDRTVRRELYLDLCVYVRDRSELRRRDWEEVWVQYDSIIRHLGWLMCPNLTDLRIHALQPGSGLAIVLAQAIAQQLNKQQALLKTLRSLNLHIRGQTAGDLFQDLLPVANLPSLRRLRAILDRNSNDARNFAQDTGLLVMRPLAREDLRLSKLKTLRIRGDAPEVKSFRRLLSALPSLTGLHFTTRSLIDPETYFRAMPYDNPGLKKLTLYSSTVQAEISPNLHRVGPFNRFEQLEELVVQALWLLSPPRESRKDAVNTTDRNAAMRSLPRPFIEILPSSLKSLGIALPSRMDLVERCSLLFEGFAEGLGQKLPRLTRIQFAEHSRAIIEPLQEQLKAVGSEVKLEVGPWI